MRILFVIGCTSKTSIPLDWVWYLQNRCEVTLLVFNDSTHKAQSNLAGYHCTIIGCDFRKHPWKALKMLRNQIRKGKYDVVHTHHTLSGSLSRIFAKRKGAKVLHTVHANHHGYSLWQNLVIGMTLGKCNTVVYNSHASLNGLFGWQRWISRKCRNVVIHNGVDCDKLDRANTAEGIALIQKYALSDNDQVFGTVGRMVQVKDQLTILKAFMLLCREKDFSNARLILIGDGNQETALKVYVDANKPLHDKVFCLGLRDRDTTYTLMKQMDVFVIASLHEGFCNALMEAECIGIPAIVTDIPVFHEVLDEGDALMFPPQNVAKLKEKMEYLIRHKQTVEEQQKRAEKTRKKYGLEHCVDKYYEEYTMLEG